MWGECAASAGHRAPAVVAMGGTMHRAGQLLPLAASYAVVVIDCPPRLGDIQRSALMVADLAVLPCGPSPADAWALAGTAELVAEAQAVRPALQACIVLTRKQGRTAVGHGARAVVATTGLSVCQTELGYRVAYQEMLAGGQGVTTYAPRDAAAKEVRALFEELMAFAGRDHGTTQKSTAPHPRSKAAAAPNAGGVRAR
jgi:chromosome partitioning protein